MYVRLSLCGAANNFGVRLSKKTEMLRRPVEIAPQLGLSPFFSERPLLLKAIVQN